MWAQAAALTGKKPTWQQCVGVCCLRPSLVLYLSRRMYLVGRWSSAVTERAQLQQVGCLGRGAEGQRAAAAFRAVTQGRLPRLVLKPDRGAEFKGHRRGRDVAHERPLIGLHAVQHGADRLGAPCAMATVFGSQVVTWFCCCAEITLKLQYGVGCSIAPCASWGQVLVKQKN